MARIERDQIEIEARELLREAIERSGWYPALTAEQRRKRIEQDVDEHWHLMVPEVARRLQAARVASRSTMPDRSCSC